ncbi:hypothetical protein FA95DRAFT_1561078 [Auriscalpium vulgare]|uniref:Uncharacterized protein n=1 Tax=Auriscalpium vulgare TaxID=40419 RepID=A0ACB8RN75_9AGAM|nr:hypothetical protein FA95DRAFT_1561078 [Auriscalpium vulgare]
MATQRPRAQPQPDLMQPTIPACMFLSCMYVLAFNWGASATCLLVPESTCTF